MKICPKCNVQLDDGAVFCHHCGQKQDGFDFAQQNPGYYAAPNPYDHTSEFSAKDISDNKVVSMLVYLAGFIGIIIALLAANASPYAGFHVRQALKFTVIETLTAIVTALLCWTFIVPIAAGIFFLVLFVIKIIAFFQICQGKAIEPALIRSFGFLK